MQGTESLMNDFPHARTDGLSDKDLDELTLIASTSLQQGESILDLRAVGIDKVQINVGIILSKRAGSGRRIEVERIDGVWTVLGVRGWFA